MLRWGQKTGQVTPGGHENMGDTEAEISRLRPACRPDPPSAPLHRSSFTTTGRVKTQTAVLAELVCGTRVSRSGQNTILPVWDTNRSSSRGSPSGPSSRPASAPLSQDVPTTGRWRDPGSCARKRSEQHQRIVFSC